MLPVFEALYDFAAAYWKHYSFWSDEAKLMTTHALSPKGGGGAVMMSQLWTLHLCTYYMFSVYLGVLEHQCSIGLYSLSIQCIGKFFVYLY